MAETVIEAFDKFATQKEPDTFAVAVLDNVKMRRTKALPRKIIDLVAH